jgi:hypothetical protein
MQHNTTHMIRREVFELSTSHSKDGLECQQRASGMVHNIIHPILESCFDRLELGSRRLVIDRLEIDLGIFDAKNLERELMKRLNEMLEKELSACLQKAKSGSAKLSNTNRAELITTEELSTLPSTTVPGVQLLDAEETFYTLLYWFLQHGRLPWWLEPSKQQQPITELFDTPFITTLREEDKRSFRELLRHSQPARIRLVNHFTTEWIVNFLQHIDIPVSKPAVQWQVLLPAIETFSTLQTIFHQHFWTVAITGHINITLVIEKTARGYNPTAIALSKAILAICQTFHTQDTAWAAWAEQIEKYLSHKMPYDDFRKQPTNEQPQQTTISQPKNEIEEEGLFVSAAGLVILHPFLTELFTGLWQDNQWKDEYSVYRAVQLLSQLAYGETNLPEYQLSFIKILLGIDIETPLPAQEPLTESEITTCTELLQAVITHWTALRNTGPATVQEGFLQRHGKLIHHKKGYHVTVERLAQDVLLSRLPWGIGMIKLPWMQDMLHVTWL